MNIASSLQIHFIMGHPKQIVLSFEAFDRHRTAHPESQLIGSIRLPHIEYHDLSVPFAELEDVKKAIHGCFTKPIGYSRSFEGDRLAFSLQSLSHAGCLNSEEVEILISELTGSTIQYSGSEIVDLALISGNFSMVAFKVLLGVEERNSGFKSPTFQLEMNSRFLRCFKRKRVKYGRAVQSHHFR